MEGEFADQVQHWCEIVLMWVGFGTVTGLLAKAIMPGRDPGGPIATLAMGIGGSIIGCAVLAYFYGGERVSPISPLGFVVAVAGAFVILGFYRLLSGRVIDEGGHETVVRRPSFFRSRRRRRYVEHETE
ncbi:GlsB/YeaQ/YmgE family stress response membrane protein [Blastopirellula sp. JC732]|uniref:GlsB/YeaQ/YmgE family stress response membrane protein n=1 Tax=Blastopirellula sediminis TaxID=2894196 RepID=A0A9X1MRX6_9BACT|nr:GlsB/YeaQ/YmgE family stress response membrane protein [Blastopirellula sediminis]MCC9605176.1 GlsB/YeaQ/YmgE family stress response membrane protein [Blastopirellula sediminis]MCC9631524.1 GlsB/YeaQ/YmgE family stress response membrane protein [Blastopirellula sediminis]